MPGIVIATSVGTQDDPIAQLAYRLGVACFRGSETNVLDRYVQCARMFGFSQIIRLTADNPFIDVEELPRLMAAHLKGHADYSLNVEELPIGAGAEMFTFSALERSLRHASAPHHFEHVNEYILEHPEDFRTIRLSVDDSKKAFDLRLTVDTPEDYQRACSLAERFNIESVTTPELIAFLRLEVA
jgi:spore coat polysaccharide biosynthesis protein SpsF